MSAGMLVHVWHTRRSDIGFRLMRCNCSTYFLGLPHNAHSSELCGIDKDRVYRLGGIPCSTPIRTLGADPSQSSITIDTVGRHIDYKAHYSAIGVSEGWATAKCASEQEALLASTALNCRLHGESTVRTCLDRKTSAVGHFEPPLIVNGSGCAYN